MTRRHLVALMQGAVAVAAHFGLNVLGFLAAWALVPMMFGWVPTAVMSGSMEPTLTVGEIVVAQPVSQDEIRAGLVQPGRVVLADNPMDTGTLYTHRVTAVLPDGRFVTKGDNNGSLDPEPLSPEKIVGVERMKIPLVGYPIQGIHSGNPWPAAAFVGFIAVAAAVIRSDDARRESKVTYSTRAEAKAARKRKRGVVAKAASSVATIAALAAALIVGGATANFTGTTANKGSSWAAASSFGGSPQVASCGGGTYTVSAGATVTCAVGTVSGTTTNYTLTVTGTGALVQWTVTTDWSGVTKFQSAKAYGTGVSDTGTITQVTGYKIGGAANGCQPSASCNHAYVSSTKAAEVFTVQVVVSP